MKTGTRENLDVRSLLGSNITKNIKRFKINKFGEHDKWKEKTKTSTSSTGTTSTLTPWIHILSRLTHPTNQAKGSNKFPTVWTRSRLGKLGLPSLSYVSSLGSSIGDIECDHDRGRIFAKIRGNTCFYGDVDDVDNFTSHTRTIAQCRAMSRTYVTRARLSTYASTARHTWRTDNDRPPRACLVGERGNLDMRIHRACTQGEHDITIHLGITKQYRKTKQWRQDYNNDGAILREPPFEEQVGSVMILRDTNNS